MPRFIPLQLITFAHLIICDDDGRWLTATQYLLNNAYGRRRKEGRTPGSMYGVTPILRERM